MGLYVAGPPPPPYHHIAQPPHCQEHGQPLKDFLGPALQSPNRQEDNAARRQAGEQGQARPQPDAAELVFPAHPASKGQDDADNKGGLQSLPQGDEKRSGHTTSFAYSAPPEPLREGEKGARAFRRGPRGQSVRVPEIPSAPPYPPPPGPGSPPPG